MTREEVIQLEDAPVSSEPPKPVLVPMATFPPTAMVYSMNKVMSKTENPNTRNGASDTVPMDVITRALSHPDPVKRSRRTFICLQCRRDVCCNNKETQVNMSRETYGSSDNLSDLRVHRQCARTRSNSSESEMFWKGKNEILLYSRIFQLKWKWFSNSNGNTYFQCNKYFNCFSSFRIEEIFTFHNV